MSLRGVIGRTYLGRGGELMGEELSGDWRVDWRGGLLIEEIGMLQRQIQDF